MRFLAFSGHHIPTAATISGDFIFSLSGLLNAILYVVTRPELVKGSSSELGTPKDQPPHRISRDLPRSIEKRALPKVHGLGHLPDRSDDDLRDHHREMHSAGTIEIDTNMPWMIHAAPPPLPQSLSHSRSDSGQSSLDRFSSGTASHRLWSTPSSAQAHLPTMPLGSVHDENNVPQRHASLASSEGRQRPRGARKLGMGGDLGVLEDVHVDLDKTPLGESRVEMEVLLTQDPSHGTRRVESDLSSARWSSLNGMQNFPRASRV